jgi:hypothetical protein
MRYSWTCHCCGKQFNELPLSVALAAPDPWLELTDSEQQARGEIGSDYCIIDERYFFVRGCLEIPITDSCEIFNWSMWVSVSKQSFERIGELWDAEIRRDQPPIFGWLCNNIQGYPQTFGLKTNLHLRNHGIRPFIELGRTEHPLALEQRQGILLKRVEKIVAAARLH